MCFAESVNSPDGRNVPEKKVGRSKDELRELWRTAIKQQILLQRMEKENLKLKGDKWEEVEKTASFQMLFSGVCRHRVEDLHACVCACVCLCAHVH